MNDLLQTPARILQPATDPVIPFPQRDVRLPRLA
jgi:hypothetical protein